MEAHIEHIGADLLCRAKSAPAELRIPGDQALGQLKEWAKRYAAAVRHDGEAELLAIGREMFAWLDSNGWASAWAKSTGPRALEIQVDDLDEALAQAMLDAPWELLAHRNGYLADDGIQIFEVVRRIGPRAEAIVPRYSDMQLMFMAAAPQKESPLDFEAEEAAILEVTARLPLHLVVEESGVAEFLGEHLHLNGPFEALHLSCHGDIDPKRGHILALEDEIGERADADANDIVRLLGDPEQTPLVFLSACRTAEQIANDGEGARRFEPFVRDLTRAGVANVLGWDGSVYDTDAAAFARTFYRELAGRERIPRAAAAARLALRRTQQEDPQRGSHWHLARLYLGPRGGGALAVGGLPKRKLAGAAWEEQFLDKVRGEVPVARRSEFVGRRRQAQRVLKAFRDGSAGVLIQGMGNLGKSSLAARIASRMTGHTTVVVFGVYDALTVFDRIVEALPPQQRAEVRASWREAVLADATALSDALEALLEGPLDQQPALLIIDDLERILKIPEQSDAPTPVQQRYHATIKAVLCAFARAQTKSRLLITCRYRFSLPDGRGGDLAENLTCIPLQPMEPVDRSKQLRAAARAENIVEESSALEKDLVLRAIGVARGNPGLQTALMTPILKGETEAARKGLESIEYFQQTGAPPEAIQKLIEVGEANDDSNVMVGFFKRMAFHTYRAALTKAQTATLRAASIFSIDLPIPRPALEVVAKAAGVEIPAKAIERLIGLGILDDWGVIDGIAHAAANPLARSLISELDDAETSVLAQHAAKALYDLWIAGGQKSKNVTEVARLSTVSVLPSSSKNGHFSPKDAIINKYRLPASARLNFALVYKK